MLELSKVAGNDIEINYISIYPQGMARKGNFEKDRKFCMQKTP